MIQEYKCYQCLRMREVEIGVDNKKGESLESNNRNQIWAYSWKMKQIKRLRTKIITTKNKNNHSKSRPPAEKKY